MHKFVHVERGRSGFPSTGSGVYRPGMVATIGSTRDQGAVTAQRPSEPAGRPVVLATLSVRVDPRAERMAIESALESNPAHPHLILANMLWLPPHPTTLTLAR